MYTLAPRQHLDPPCNSLGPGRRSDGRLHAPDHGIAVAGFEGREEGLRRRTAHQRGLPIVWRRGRASAVIGTLSTAIGLGCIDLRLTSGLHSPCFDERSNFGHIRLGTDAARTTRGETLQKVRLTNASLLTIDPAPAQCDLHGFGVRDAGNSSPLFCDLEPPPPEVP
jgi:hypothetical protein